MQMSSTLRCALGLAGLFGCLTGCADKPKEAPQPIIRPVRYMEVQNDEGALRRTFTGSVKAGTESRLSFRVPGRVLEVPIKLGDRVKTGQLIARLDNADFQLQLQDARSAVARAEAQARNAQSTYQRVRALYENQNTSRQELDGARTQAETAQASLSSISQNVRLLERQLEYTRLTAPSAGSISRVATEAGENVAAGQVVAVVQVGDQLEVEVAVPEALINRVEQGSAVTVRVNALPDHPFEGVVSEVGVASEQAAVYPVVVRLPTAHDGVRAGMAAQVSFEFAARRANDDRDVYVLPASAVGEDRDGRFVYLVDRTEPGFGKVRRQAVTIGDISSTGLEVRQGVAQGDLVVTAGVGRIQDGLIVKLPETQVAAADPSSADTEDPPPADPPGPASTETPASDDTPHAAPASKPHGAAP